MSLLRIRRERKERGYGAQKGMPSARLVILLVLVLTLMWYLGRL